MPAKAGIQEVLEKPGFAKFTNEVQHLIKVLLWDKNMFKSVARSGVRLPVYKPRGARSVKSRQLWIARHRQLLEK